MQQPNKLDKFEATVLQGWEEIHNKNQLSLWLLLALKDAPKYKDTIKSFIDTHTNGQVRPDDKSIYRALRRFKGAELVEFELHPSDNGPDHKVYHLTKSGQKVLQAFLERNVANILYKPQIRTLIEKG